MPFTLAHPAIILPLNKSKRFSITALIAGSMVPDFEFFFQLREVENIGHHWYGILLFDFPVALFFCFIFHNLLRNALVINLPASMRNRVAGVPDFDWNSYAWTNKWTVALSLFTGIASHILLDGFTHYDGLFTELFPLLATKISISSFAIPVYFLLQLLFSVMGLVVVCYTILRLPQQQTTISEEKNKWYWPLFAFTVSLLLCIRLVGWPQYNSFWGVFMAVMGSICYCWVFISVVFKNYFIKKLSL
jgi:membrane-bound metal-dependent hydrolase YbcI (DUF457 family)